MPEIRQALYAGREETDMKARGGDTFWSSRLWQGRQRIKDVLKLESIKGRRELSRGKCAVTWSCCHGRPVKAASHPSDVDLTVHAYKRQTGTIWTSNCEHWNEHAEFAEINYVCMCSRDCLKLYTNSVVTWGVIFFSPILNPNTKTSRVKYSINCTMFFSLFFLNWDIIDA